MQKLSRLRGPTQHPPVASLTPEESNYNNEPQIEKHGPPAAANPAGVTRTRTPSRSTTTHTTTEPTTRGDDQSYGEQGLLPAPLTAARSRRQSLVLDGGQVDERGCMDAVSAFLLAIASAPPPVPNKPESSQQVGGMLPQLLRATKGAGTMESRDSSRDLLRFFGHSPVLHLEAVVWIKAKGERVHCIAALSNWSLFLVPFRDPASVGGIIHSFYQAKQKNFAQIVEIPLRSILDVAMVSARESLHTFANFEANWVSRPFRIVTTTTSHSGTIDKEASKSVAAVSGNESVLTFVGFEVICRLRHFLVLACESWTVRAGATLGVAAPEMLSCAPAAAQRYLNEVYKAMTGPLRHQADAQVELMEDLADEMILDTVLKDVFFSTGDILFELARRLERTVTEATTAATSSITTATAAAAAGGGGGQRALDEGGGNGTLGGGRASRRSAGTDARLLSATAAVFDAAFFHSMQLPQKMDIFMLSTPMSLPKIAEMFVRLYCNVNRRWLGNHSGSFGGGSGGGGGDRVDGELHHGDSRQDLCIPSPRTSLGEYDTGGEHAPVEPETWGADGIISRRRTRTLDCVVRALNGISDAITLFNVEHEHLGIVRNLVGVGLGSAWRAGVQPAASDALGFLVAVNDRVVHFIEELNLREQEQRKILLEEAEQRGSLSEGAQETPGGRRGKGKRRPFFRPISRFRGENRSPGSRLSKSAPTRPSGKPSRPPEVFPGLPPESAVKGPITDDARRDDTELPRLLPRAESLDKDVRLHRLLESGDRPEDSGGKAAATDGNNNHEAATYGNNREAATDENTHNVSGSRTPGGAGGKFASAPPSSLSPRAPCLHGAPSPRDFSSSAPVLLHSYAKLLNALVCGSYNLRAAFSSSCEADLRNIRRKGGYLDALAGLDGGSPRKIFREAARFLHEILIECDCR